MHRDVMTGALNTTTKAGLLHEADSPEFNAEFEPLGAIIPTEDPIVDPDIAPLPPNIKFGGNPFGPESECEFMWSPMDCNQVRSIARKSGNILGGAVISLTRYVEDNDVEIRCDEFSDPDCEPVPADPSEPTVTYNVNITPLAITANMEVHSNDVSEECQKALDVTSKDSNSVKRALANWDLLMQVEKKYGIDAAILAAIGVRESEFDSVKEIGGGKGRGVFQIDMGWHSGSISEADAMDMTESAFYMGKILRGWYDDHYEAAQASGYSIVNNSRPSVSSIAASIHAYNSGKAYTRHYKNPKDVSQGFNYTLSNGFKSVLDGGGVNSLDAGTTGLNYVSNVWNIARDCFGYGGNL